DRGRNADAGPAEVEAPAREVEEIGPRVVDDCATVATRRRQAGREGEAAGAGAAATAGRGAGRGDRGAGRRHHDAGGRGLAGRRRGGRHGLGGGRADYGGGGRHRVRGTGAVVLALPLDVPRAAGGAGAAPGRIALFPGIDVAVAATRGRRGSRRAPGGGARVRRAAAVASLVGPAGRGALARLLGLAVGWTARGGGGQAAVDVVGGRAERRASLIHRVAPA